MASESAQGIGGNSQRAIIHSREIKISNNPMSRVKDNVLLHLATHPFRDSCGIVLESGTGNLTDNLVLDGIKPFDARKHWSRKLGVPERDLLIEPLKNIQK